MIDFQTRLEAFFRLALTTGLGEEYADADPLIRPAGNPDFGDYQANIAMGLAKRLGQKPRDIAGKIVDHLQTGDLIEKVEIAGPGFINLTLTAAALEACAGAMLADDRLGVPVASSPRTVVVDYSGPNVAKEMHIGHLRSTILGDAIVRVLRFQGHHVIGQNHLGDWGTQFGMLIEYMMEREEAGADTRSMGTPSPSPSRGEGGNAATIGDLNAFYQAAKQRFDEDADFATRARERVVKLQAGDPDTLARWRRLVEQSKVHFDAIYQRLGIKPGSTELEYRPESSYNDLLPGIITDLDKAGLLHESEGAKVVYPRGFVNREGEPLAMIVQKRDEGYLYATTDLAAARYRVQELSADQIIYVTDARQSQHFAMVFETLRQAGWVNDTVMLNHVPFGSILGKDRKPFKTRAGGVVKLADVLDEAEQRAAAVIAGKNPDLSVQERERIAHVVGVGALKYGDLSNDRVKDYVFDWDRMLALDGNTAPYLQNAYVRIESIFRKVPPEAACGLASSSPAAIRLTHRAERALVLHLSQFPQAVGAVAESLEPHRLCNDLYELAAKFHQFYEHCPVLAAPDEATRDSRLRLCALTARTLKLGLELLDIGVVERM